MPSPRETIQTKTEPKWKGFLSNYLEGAINQPIYQQLISQLESLSEARQQIILEKLDKVQLEKFPSQIERRSLLEGLSLGLLTDTCTSNGIITKTECYEAVKRWRKETAQRLGCPAYCILTNRCLDELATVRPKTATDLQSIRGIGRQKIEKYGTQLLQVLQG